MAQIDDLLTQLTAQVDAAGTVEDGAVTFVNGVPAMIAAAVAAANGAGSPLTPAQVQIFTDLGTKITQKASDISAAIANVSTPPASPSARRP